MVVDLTKYKDEVKNKDLYFGYRIVEDDSVKELRLPKDVIEFLSNFANWKQITKELEDKETVPNKFYICGRCGYKRPKIKDTHANMFLCPKCHRPLREN